MSAARGTSSTASSQGPGSSLRTASSVARGPPSTARYATRRIVLLEVPADLLAAARQLRQQPGGVAARSIPVLGAEARERRGGIEQQQTERREPRGTAGQAALAVLAHEVHPI